MRSWLAMCHLERFRLIGVLSGVSSGGGYSDNATPVKCVRTWVVQFRETGRRKGQRVE
jgi:hypothetical protein